MGRLGVTEAEARDALRRRRRRRPLAAHRPHEPLRHRRRSRTPPSSRTSSSASPRSPASSRRRYPELALPHRQQRGDAARAALALRHGAHRHRHVRPRAVQRRPLQGRPAAGDDARAPTWPACASSRPASRSATAGASSPTAPRASRIVPIGYADGVARALTNRGDVLVAGRRCRIAGTISMDQLTVLLPEDHGRPGDEVVFFGLRRVAAGDRRRRRASSARRSRGCSRPSTTRSSATCRRGWCAATAARASGRGPATVDAPSGVADGCRAAVALAAAIVAAARACLAPGEPPGSSAAAVRDELLGHPSSDVDFVVDGDRRALRAALADRLGGAVFAPSERFGTWRVVVGGRHVDVAPLRGPACGRDRGAGPDRQRDRPRVVADLRARERAWRDRSAARRRSIDPLGGRADLAARRLRLCRRRRSGRRPAARAAPRAAGARLRPACPTTAALAAARRAPRRRLARRQRRARPRRALGARSPLVPTPPPRFRLPRRSRRSRRRPPRARRPARRRSEPLPPPATCSSTRSRRWATCPAWSTARRRGLPGLAGRGRPARRAAPLVPLAWAVLLHDIGKPAVRAVDDDGRIIFWHHDERRPATWSAQIGERLRLSRRFAALPRDARASAPAPWLPGARAAAHAAGAGALPARRRARACSSRSSCRSATAWRRAARRRRARRSRATTVWRARCGRGERRRPCRSSSSGDDVMELLGVAAGAGRRRRRWRRSRRRSRPARSRRATRRAPSCCDWWQSGEARTGRWRPARARDR